MLNAAKDKAIIASVKAGIAENFKIKGPWTQEAYTESIIKKFRQESTKPCLTPLEAGVHLTKTDQPQTEADKAKMRSKPYRSLAGSLVCGARPEG
ncbi:hypothetical protein PC114_g26302 [Phytophthora cactorum]|nr:hypothetical protein PC114_g26302 [Phytophthora cactorum]